MTAPAGWYPNPEDATQMRYWDGVAWTDHTAPGDGSEPTIPLAMNAPPPPPPPPPPVGPAPMANRSTADGPHAWYLKKWVWITGGVLVLLGIIGAVSGNNDTSPVADKPANVVTVTATPTPTSTPSPTDTPTPTPTPSPTEKAAPVADSWVMPNEVGTVLQTAQDDIQALTGNPFFYTSSEDARGDSRFQILDRDWKVCSQKPRQGTRFTEDTDITFFVVKLEERCP